jgi:hypothetical protein
MNTSQLLQYRQERVMIISISARKGNAAGFPDSWFHDNDPKRYLIPRNPAQIQRVYAATGADKKALSGNLAWILQIC